MPELTSKRVIVITGAAQGLGYALTAWFCRYYGDTAIVYATGRNMASVTAASKKLRSEHLTAVPAVLDVADHQSVQAFGAMLSQAGQGIDIFIANAAARITPDKSPAEQVAHFVQTNNLGTTAVLQMVQPLLRDNARVIVIASSFGSLRHLPTKLHHHFATDSASLADIDTVMQQYAQQVIDGTDQAADWPEWINIASKVGQVASTKVFARLHAAEFKRRGIRVNAACPGLMDTEASRQWFSDTSMAAKPETAAEDIAWLAMLPTSTSLPNAELIQHRRVIDWQ